MLKLATLAAFAALVVTASASAIPDPNGVSGYDAARALTDAARPTLSVSPDDRAFNRASALEAAAQSSVGPDDRAFSRSPALETQYVPEPVQIVVHDKDGYHWLDAGEGAIAGFAFAALLAGLMLLIIRSRRVVPAT
jgi:hypothetical protein